MKIEFNPPHGEKVLKTSKDGQGLEITINPEFEKLIPNLSITELSLLETNLEEEGCRQPLVIWNGILVDGHNRYRLCKEKGISFQVIEKHFSSEDDAKLWMITNQLARRNLINVARLRLEDARQEILSKKAKENSLSNLKQFQAVDNQESTDSALVRCRDNEEIGKVSKEIAKRTGIGSRTVEKYNHLAKYAEGEILDQMCEGAFDEEGKKMTIAREYNKLKKKQRLEELRHKGFPLSKYRVIYADGKSMSLDEMKRYPVNELAKESSILFFWTFVPHLKDSMDLLKYWGFEYARTLLWDFVRPYEFGCTELTHEFLLVAHKGDWTGVVPENSQKLPSLFQKDRGDKDPYEARPQEYKEMIHKLYPSDIKVDLFSRETSEGWEVYNQENNAKKLWS